MNATKRKFNALLNGIGNKSTTSLSKDVNNGTQLDLTTGGDTDSLSKKRRVAATSSASSQAVVSKSANSVQSATIGHKKAVSTASGLVNKDTPKYAPWDRVAFLKRLKSFSNLTEWTPKPPKVNEVAWAKRGWVCQKAERVRCCLCNVEVLVKLNRKEVDGKEEPVYIAQNIEDALVEKYVELIITSHNEDCLWRKRGCDDSIFKMPLTNTPVTLHNLRERYDELCARKDTLPYTFNLHLPSEFDLSTILNYLPSDFFAPSSELSLPQPTSTDINTVAFQMALFGWEGHTHERLGAQFGSVSCHACFRVLGLWLFKSKKVNEAGEEVEGAVVDCLNVVNEHREYCPWRNPTSQNGSAKSSTSSMAGWEIIIRVLKNDFYLKHSADRSAEQPRPATSSNTTDIFGAEVESDDARSIREEKDNERWTRLRRVKSLFDTKSGKKLHRTDTKKT